MFIIMVTLDPVRNNLVQVLTFVFYCLSILCPSKYLAPSPLPKGIGSQMGTGLTFGFGSHVCIHLAISVTKYLTGSRKTNVKTLVKNIGKTSLKQLMRQIEKKKRDVCLCEWVNAALCAFVENTKTG